MTSIEALAERALSLPDDYFPGSDDEGETWGHIGVGYTRDSGPGDIAIAEAVYAKLHDEFPDDFKWQRASHWGFGWCQEILCRVKDDRGDLTDAFRSACEYADGFDRSEFESAVLAAEHEETIENIGREWSACLTIPSDLSEDEAHRAVFAWFFENDVPAGGDDGTWFSREEIEKAGFHLGFWDYEWAPDEFWEMLDVEEAEDDFRHWCTAVWREEHERTQGVLPLERSEP